MTLDDPTVMAEPWPDQSRVATAELLDEIRRSHAEIDQLRALAAAWRALSDEWKGCAGQWRRRCDDLEAKLGEACDIAEKAMDRVAQESAPNDVVNKQKEG